MIFFLNNCDNVAVALQEISLLYVWCIDLMPAVEHVLFKFFNGRDAAFISSQHKKFNRVQLEQKQ